MIGVSRMIVANIGWMAERSKAPVSGTGLFGGVGSNPTPIIFLFPRFLGRPAGSLFFFVFQNEQARTHENLEQHDRSSRQAPKKFGLVSFIQKKCCHKNRKIVSQSIFRLEVDRCRRMYRSCGLVGYDARFTRERSPVRSWAAVFLNRV